MISIRKFRATDTLDVAFLIKKTFSEYNKKEATKDGFEKYISHYDKDKVDLNELKGVFIKTPIFFVAVDGKKIVGMVRGKKNYMINLFVDGKYHKNGIGKKLVDKFENVAKKDGSKKIKIRASLFAVPFYLRMGYKKTTGIRIFKGMKIQSMKKEL